MTLRARRLAPLALLAAGLGAIGCAHRVHDFSLVSTRPLALDGVDLDARPARRVAAEDGLWFFLFFPLGGSVQPPEVIERALDEHGADLLLDAEVWRTAWTALLVSRVGVRVEGDAVTLEEDR